MQYVWTILCVWVCPVGCIAPYTHKNVYYLFTFFKRTTLGFLAALGFLCCVMAFSSCGALLKLLSRVRLFANPMDCSLPGSSIHGIFQARVLEWVAISFSTVVGRGGLIFSLVLLFIPTHRLLIAAASVAEQGLQAGGLGCSMGSGSNLCPLHWQAYF